MIAPCRGAGKGFIAVPDRPKSEQKHRVIDHELVKRTIITPKFGQLPDML
jgi:hypothetical protein